MVLTNNDPAVQAEEEINSIEEALLKFDTPIELEILRLPTEQELVDNMKRYKPHIFHFIGHGRKGAGVNNPVLAFEAGVSGPAWEWNEDMISVDLRDWKPRFAFVNACRTSTEEAATHSWGITEAFIKAGVPAVIGMQADVLGAAAAKFPGEIYEALSSNILRISPWQQRVQMFTASAPMHHKDVIGLCLCFTFQSIRTKLLTCSPRPRRHFRPKSVLN